MISAKIVADSITPYGDRLTSMLVTFPRYILAELNTHRVLSKNSASSRAIPFKKMRESVLTNPFIPVAWQKDHSGMQGSEYLDKQYSFECTQRWLIARDHALFEADNLTSGYGATKQLSNRLLEPFMWHTVLISATDFSNFFELRCPQYYAEPEGKYYKSKKDFVNQFWNPTFVGSDVSAVMEVDDWDALKWLQLNKGQADIHMMMLAEAMWDQYQSSIPIKLKENEWHIVFEDKIDLSSYDFGIELQSLHAQQEVRTMTKVKISTGMCARTSYTVVGEEKEFGYEKQIQLHDRMATQVPFHASPFEHNARVMTQEEYDANPRCRNFSGFIQYRHLLENKNA